MEFKVGDYVKINLLVQLRSRTAIGLMNKELDPILRIRSVESSGPGYEYAVTDYPGCGGIYLNELEYFGLTDNDLEDVNATIC